MQMVRTKHKARRGAPACAPSSHSTVQVQGRHMDLPYIKKSFYRTKHAHDDAINPLIVDYVLLFNRPQNPLYRHRTTLRGVFSNQGFLVRHFREHAIQGFIQHIGF